MLHLHCLPTTHKDPCLVRVGLTCVTKPAVSRLLFEIQHSLWACLIGNEPKNTLSFFFNSMHRMPIQHVRSVTLCHPLYLCLNIDLYRILSSSGPFQQLISTALHKSEITQHCSTVRSIFTQQYINIHCCKNTDKTVNAVWIRDDCRLGYQNIPASFNISLHHATHWDYSWYLIPNALLQ